MLLYGPPGTGKTLLVRTLAAEAGLNLIAVAIPQLVRPEVRSRNGSPAMARAPPPRRPTTSVPARRGCQVGASERALAALFERARAHAPCLLFLDELQAIFGKRGAVGRVGRQLLSQLLLEMDAVQATRTLPRPS